MTYYCDECGTEVSTANAVCSECDWEQHENELRNEEVERAVDKRNQLLFAASEVASRVGGKVKQALSGSCYVFVNGQDYARVSDHQRRYGESGDYAEEIIL